MCEFKNVTILVPAIDETYSLAQTVDKIIDDNPPEDLAEIIFLFCNRTTIESRTITERLIEKYEEVIPMIIHEQKLPFAGGAYREGIQMATGSHLIIISSDLETPPELVKDFITLAKTHPDAIITASRWIKGGSFHGYNKVKLVCNFIFEHIIAWLFFSNLSDLTFGYRIFPTELMKRINWEELKHPFFLETALKPLRLRTKFYEVPAKWVARTEGVSQNGFWQNFAYFKTAFHIRFMRRKDILLSDGAEVKK